MKHFKTLSEHLNALKECGHDHEAIKATFDAWASQQLVADAAGTCNPPCSNGFICNTSTKQCVPDIGVTS